MLLFSGLGGGWAVMVAEFCLTCPSLAWAGVVVVSWVFRPFLSLSRDRTEVVVDARMPGASPSLDWAGLVVDHPPFSSIFLC